MGVVFDIQTSFFDGFMENYERLRETEERVDFEVTKCTDLPELEEDLSAGAVPQNGNWRQPSTQ